MVSEPAAPAVVVAVVANDPGDWFEEALASLAAQDYANYSVTVVDTSPAEGLAERVTTLLPEAQVLRALTPGTFADAANYALAQAAGVGHVLLCHDDVALAPDALRLLVEEAYRRNGGLTCPKLVAWEAPEILLSVGLGADRLGVAHPLVEAGELDQGQHDAAHEVFLAPTAALLVRTDLWRALEGFDPAIGSPGEELELSWRAQLAGARVVVAPHARVRHLEANTRALRPGGPGGARLEAKREVSRLRTLWSCYSWWALLIVVPASLLFALAEALWGLGHHKKSAEVLGPFWALGASVRRPRLLWRARRRAQRARAVSDLTIWKAQSKGSARVRSLVRQRLERGHELAWAASRAAAAPAVANQEGTAAPEHPLPTAPAKPDWRATAGVVAVVAAVLLIGSRHALGQGVPLVGQVPSTVGGMAGWWRAWWSGPGAAGLGARPLGLPGSFVLGLVGLLAGGSATVAVHYLVFGPLLVGPLGVLVGARPFAHQRGRLAATVVYAALPVAYNAIAQGHLAGLVVYAVAPWLIGQLGRLSGTAPFTDRSSGSSWSRFLALGLFVAAAASIAPPLLLMVLVVGAALAAGSLLVGSPQSAWPLLRSAVVTEVVAFVALLPWSWGLVHSWTALIGAAGPSADVPVSALLRFHSGPFGAGYLAWAVVVAAAVCLVIGRSWRLAWAGRLWTVALACFALAWAGGRGWLAVPEMEVLLAPAAAALAFATALGGAAVETDLSGYRFGWRQFVPALGALAVLVASVPVLGWAESGQWDLPSTGAGPAFAFPAASTGDYRALWVGPASQLPLAAQGRLGALSLATSEDGVPAAAQGWAPGGPGEAPLVARYLGLALDGQTTSVGRLLRPFAVRYVLVRTVPATRQLADALERQLDLVVSSPASGYRVFANVDWAPIAAVVSGPVPSRAPASELLRSRLHLVQPLVEGQAAVTGAATGAQATVRGPTTGRALYGAVPNHLWHASADGRALAVSPALGWASAWALPPSQAPLHLVVSPTGTAGRHVVDVVMLVLWVAGASLAGAGLRSRWRAQLALASLELGSPANQVSEIDWSAAMEGENIG